jgi:hypothetical protein
MLITIHTVDFRTFHRTSAKCYLAGRLKPMSRLFFLLFSLFVFMACSPTKKSMEKYEGRLPCADCPGIMETLTLHYENRGEGTYELNDLYLEKDPSTAFYNTGRWKLVIKNPGPMQQRFIQLNPDRPEALINYLLTDSFTLINCGKQEEPFDTRGDFSLYRRK